VPNTAVPTRVGDSGSGARPVFVDIRDEDFLMDVSQVEAAITPRTKAIVPVHLYGQCVDLDPLLEIAKRHGLKVIEDCAQSQGALYKNRRCGSIGTASPSHSIRPSARRLWRWRHVLSDDEAVIHLARSLRFYGMEKTTMRKARLQFAARRSSGGDPGAEASSRTDGWIDRRREIAGRYRQGFAGSGLQLPKENDYAGMYYHLFVVETAAIATRSCSASEARGLKCGVHYRWPIHLDARV